VFKGNMSEKIKRTLCIDDEPHIIGNVLYNDDCSLYPDPFLQGILNVFNLYMCTCILFFILWPPCGVITGGRPSALW